MFKSLFTIAALLLLAATPGECDSTEIPDGVGSALEAANVALDLGTVTLAEKVKHYQSLINVVKSLGEEMGIGDICLGPYLYMVGPLGVSKASSSTDNNFKA